MAENGLDDAVAKVTEWNNTKKGDMENCREHREYILCKPCEDRTELETEDLGVLVDTIQEYTEEIAHLNRILSLAKTDASVARKADKEMRKKSKRKTWT